MSTRLSSYLLLGAVSAAITVSGLLVFRAYSQPSGFRASLHDFLNTHAKRTDAVSAVASEKAKGEDSELIRYERGDWEEYVTGPKYRLLAGDVMKGHFTVEEDDDMDIISYGSMKMNMLYGKSKFTKDRYRLYDRDTAVSKVIKEGLTPEREIKLHIEGTAGKRLTLYIDHDSRKSDNNYVMKYRAIREDEVIREINAGEIDIKFSHSKYAVYDNNAAKGLGIDMTMRRDKLSVKLFGSVLRGETVVERFTGNSSANSVNLRDYQYMRNRYFQLEPFRRYDGITTAPAAGTSYVTLTSNPANPETYTPYSVNIDSTGFELYMDDMNSLNNAGSIQIGVDDGHYTKLVSGVDYTINYTTGLISFLKTVPDNARVFAVYTLNGGSTSSSDPTARTDVFSGKLFVFIKYGYSINEDYDRDMIVDSGESVSAVINDGRLNMDIYEVRSFYRIGETQILDENLNVSLYQENTLLTRAQKSRAGKHSVDTSGGILVFTLREPFRQLLGGASAANAVYAEAPTQNKSLSSKYVLRVSYYREARSFQLQHTNIVEGSVSVRINNRDLPKSYYTVDNVSGFFQFTDPSNPVISSTTNIEIRYQYLPAGAQSQSFTGGARADYKLTRNLDIGGTFLFTRSSGGTTVPDVGNEPEQVMVFEGDARLHLGGKQLAGMLNLIPGVALKSVPLKMDAYAEYARSYRNINSFGKALIDDMESTDVVTSISLDERDWILASPAASNSHSERGKLLYYYYRTESSPGVLRTPSFTPRAVEYAAKAGPYNLATGHVSTTIRSESDQRSLGLSFNFEAGKSFVSIATRRLSSTVVDFSGLQYVEIWYRSTGGTGTVSLALDIGSINEDSDGDGLLDTEDLDRDGYLDSDPAAGVFEDCGYAFNPTGADASTVGGGAAISSATRGDGILTSEDLDGNGILDTTERVVRAPASFWENYTEMQNINLADTSWRRIRLYLNKNAADYITNASLYEDILSQVESIRLSVGAGTAASGTLYIDTVKFVSSRWRTVELDDTVTTSPSSFKVTVVDTLSDSDYRADAFLFQMKSVYTSLHGEKSNDELNREQESALSIAYNLAGYSKGSVTRRFSQPMDLRFYKTLNMWINCRSFNSGDTVGVILGSSEGNYVEYRFAPEYLNLWKEVSLRLASGSGGTVPLYATAGNPDFKRITFMKLVVYSAGGGRIWFNDIYVSEPETLRDDAHWYELQIQSTRALARTASGVPILSDMNIRFISKGHGAQFSTVGQTVNDMSENFYQVFSSVNILPNWNAKLDYTAERSSTDSLNEKVSDDRRGTTNRQGLYFESHYKSGIDALPSVKMLYRQERYDNTRDQFISSDACERRRHTVSHAPVVLVEEKIADVLGGSITATMQLDLYFADDRIRRSSKTLSSDQLASYVSLDEIESRQKGNSRLVVNYQSKIFYIQPSIDYSTHEIVRLSGKDSLSDTSLETDVSGGFHLPFQYRDDTRYVSRSKNAELRFGLGGDMLMNPSMKMNMYYNESGFRDYTASEKLISGPFARSRDAVSSVSNRIDVPMNLKRFAPLRFFESMVISYSRSLYVRETEVPYEGEGTGEFDERFGMERPFSVTMRPGLDFIRYSPWHFLKGRGNFAEGRDFAYHSLNGNIAFPGGEVAADYTNALRLIDTFSLSANASFNPLTVNVTAGLNHVSERSAVNGIPQQAITANTSASLAFDMMQVFSFGFFRPNREDLPYHAATISLTYAYSRSMLITSNIIEDTSSPLFALTFKRGRASLGVRYGMDFRFRRNHEFLDSGTAGDEEDYIYVTNLSMVEDMEEVERGYTFSILFETDVLWLKAFFSGLYELVASPIFSVEYSLLLNRYNYTVSASPDPYDQHLVTGKLTLDLHRNVQGGLIGRWALEKYRNSDTDNVYREIISYELGMNFTLLF